MLLQPTDRRWTNLRKPGRRERRLVGQTGRELAIGSQIGGFVFVFLSPLPKRLYYAGLLPPLLSFLHRTYLPTFITSFHNLSSTLHSPHQQPYTRPKAELS